ncbi:hypothetical protein CcrC1_gp270c [Caulobacter phage C1]|nr:hypothetical protein CcrC1_gp270c [Caulobacter phage C1]UTU08499.1 hypothetical protein CcrC2_gp271c [Caulobacter phage C2]WGN97166.1 hypothetical protein [Bertelyvirus sp.]WGN97684.1 hypothetical protein [Bertelyvirus sp.]
MTEKVLPIVQGDWVAEVHDGNITIGKVRQSYWCGDDVLMDVAFFDPSGVKIGRESPPEGGPKTFEPAIPFDDRWTRIEPPKFPLRRKDVRVPSETPGMVTWLYTFHHDSHDGVKRKPIRTKVRKQSRDYDRKVQVILVPAEPSNQIDIEIASLRRSAQELRDTARLLSPSQGAGVLRDKAARLEAEALALASKE